MEHKCRNSPSRSESQANRLFSRLWLEIEQFPQFSRLRSAHRDFRLAPVLHLELILTLEPGDDFLDAVDIHKVGAMDPPENVRVKVALKLFHRAEIRLAFKVLSHDADHAILDRRIDNV